MVASLVASVVAWGRGLRGALQGSCASELRGLLPHKHRIDVL